jgi:dipeptidyl aminopeptidase/acylaminoacyl peptidase
MKKSLAEYREDFLKASPHHRINEEASPFMVIHGGHDSLVPVAEARNFVARLREVSRAPVVYAELPGAQHAFDVFPSIRTAHVIRGIERFADVIYGEHVRASGARSAPR